MDRERDLPGPNLAAAGCEVRAARPADVPRIWEMLRGLAAYERLEHEVSGSPERLAEHLFGPRPMVECLVAESGRALVGYALFYPTYSSFRSAPTLWLEDLFVGPGERGKGAGRLLLAAVARLALARGCVGLGWIVLDWNRPSIAFYERAGARTAEGGWLQYGLERVGMQALTEATGPRGGA